MGNILEFRNITQTYGNKTVFKDFSFAVEDKPERGQFLAIMGESGCGKSTLLRYFTGLQKPTSGEVYLNDRPLKPTDVIPMVFQTPSSLEWYTVLDNVALPLVIKGKSWRDARLEAVKTIEVVGLQDHINKFAKSPELSGGQLQRVAIARSLVANPNILVLDEPFSALDSVTRKKMQNFIKDLFIRSEQAGLNPTFIIVTHDEREAAFLGQEVLVMGANPGSIKHHITLGLDYDLETRTNPRFFEATNYLESII